VERIRERFMSAMARLAFATFVVSLLTGLAASLGTRLHFWNYHFGLETLLPYSVYIGSAGFLLGLLWIISAIFSNSATGGGYGIAGFLGAIAVISVPLYDFATTRSLPPIHDISTDTEYAPPFAALLDRRQGAENGPDYDGPKLVRMNGRTYTTIALQKKYYGDVKTIGELVTPQKLFQHALTAAQAMGWKIVSIVPERDGGHIEATDTTFFFGFTDDIALRVKHSGLGAKLDIRSKSRAGVADFGRNAARIRAYVKKVLAGM
jgi:hypothetical protein